MMADYRSVHKKEYLDDSFGIDIRVSGLSGELSAAERIVVSRAADMIEDAIARERIARDPDREMERDIERSKILGLFQPLVYAEPIPNGYCQQACCSWRPWYIVTTCKGRIKIGWRKRVIQIDWSDSLILDTADALFPKEDVTKSDRMIHAWSYEKAAEYLARILA